MNEKRFVRVCMAPFDADPLLFDDPMVLHDEWERDRDSHAYRGDETRYRRPQWCPTAHFRRERIGLTRDELAGIPADELGAVECCAFLETTDPALFFTADEATLLGPFVCATCGGADHDLIDVDAERRGDGQLLGEQLRTAEPGQASPHLIYRCEQPVGSPARR